MRNLLLVFLVFFFLTLTNNAAFADIDSLLTVLNGSKGEKKAEVQLELCKQYKGKDTEKALEFCTIATRFYTESGNEKALSECYHCTGNVYYVKGEYPKAIVFFKDALKIRNSIGDDEGAANSLNNLGVMHRKIGQLEMALEYYIKALELKEKNGANEDIIGTINNIGSLYYTQKNYDKALKYFERAQFLYQGQKDKNGLAATYNNLSLIYFEQNDKSKAFEYNKLSYDLRKEMGDDHGMGVSLNNFGRIYELDNNYEKALENYFESEKTYKTIGDLINQANVLNNIGGIYIKLKNYKKAKEYIFRSLTLAQNLDNMPQVKDNYLSLSEVNFALGNYRDAYDYLKEYNVLKDSVLNEQSKARVEELETKYESGRKEKEIALLTKEKEMEQLSRFTEQNKNKLILNSLSAGFFLIIIIAVLLFFINRQKQKANKVLEKQNAEINLQKVEIQGKNNELGIKNKEITDSIIYAKRIQEAIFPADNFFSDLLPDSFVLFRPKDIVSGDFYWANKINSNENSAPGTLLFAAVDCTGHGVPGAFMSLVGYNLLNQAVKEHQLCKPSEILDYLNVSLNETLRQTYDESMVKDGMDISLCSLSYSKNKSEQENEYTINLEFAGAYNPVWILRKDKNNAVPELIEIKPNKHPVGAFLGEELKSFTNNEIPLKKGDKIYIFTDGYADQFGGPKGKKFKYSQLKSLLISLFDKTMEEQKSIMEKVLEAWQGDLEQVDDICIVGVHI